MIRILERIAFPFLTDGRQVNANPLSHAGLLASFRRNRPASRIVFRRVTMRYLSSLSLS